MNNFVLKLSGRNAAGFGAGIADCAILVPVLAFDPSSRDRIAAPVDEDGGRNPACTRVGKVH